MTLYHNPKNNLRCLMIFKHNSCNQYQSFGTISVNLLTFQKAKSQLVSHIPFMSMNGRREYLAFLNVSLLRKILVADFSRNLSCICLRGGGVTAVTCAFILRFTL